MMMHGIGDAASDAFGAEQGVSKTPILSAVGAIANALVQAYGQARAADINAELVKQGKPPLPAATIKAMSPALGVDIDIGDRANMVMYALLGVGIFAVIAMRSKR